jgi:hypothetical protein
MKSKLILLLLACCALSAASAQQTTTQVKLAWSAVTGSTNYTLYYGQSASFTNNLTTSNRLNAGTNLTATATVGLGTQWFFVATDSIGGLESPPSNMVSYLAPSLPQPTTLTLTYTSPPGTTVTSTNNTITFTFP